MEKIAPVDALWYTRCPVITGSGLAVQNGQMELALAKHGVSVKNLRNSTSPETRESHFTHRLPQSVRQGGNAPALFAVASGADTVLVGAQLIRQYQAVLTLRDSGIETMEDLRGRRVALPLRVNDKIDFWRSIALQGLLGALRVAGMSRDAVEWVPLPIDRTYFHELPAQESGQYVDAPRLMRQHQRELTALLCGEVDAIFGYSGWGALIRDQFNLHEVVEISRHQDAAVVANNEFPATLTITRDLIENAPDVVDAYVAEILRAESWARRNEEQAVSLLARELGLAEYWLREGTRGELFDGFTLSLDDAHLGALEVRKQFLLDEGFLPRDVVIADWVDSGPLERARAALASSAEDAAAASPWP